MFSYNYVTLPYPDIFEFREEPVRDPQSDTDWCLSKFDIKVQAVINTDYLPTVAPDLVNAGFSTAAEVMAAIRYRLKLHQKKLSVVFNGKEYIPQPQTGSGGFVDARNGPKPQMCQLFELTNTTFLLNYHIVAYYWQNPHSSGSGVTINANTVNDNNRAANVLYNRWSESIEIKNNFTTRVREGQYAIRSDNVDGLTADAIRSDMAVVSVPPGFLRRNSRYRVSEDGLVLHYRVEDEEQFKMPPTPAFEAEGYYFERTVKMGAHRIGEVRVKLKGDWGTDQINGLLHQAIRITNRKLARRSLTLPAFVGPLGGVKQGWAVLDDAGAKVDLYKNEVEFFQRVWTACSIHQIDGINAFYDLDNWTPFSESPVDYTPPYYDRGSFGLLLQAAAYYDPNFRDNVLGAGTYRTSNTLTATGDKKVQMIRGRQPGQAGKNP